MLPTAFVVALTSSCFSKPLLSSRILASGGTFVSRAIVAKRMASFASAGEATSRFIDIGANLLDDCFQGRYNGGSQKHEPDLDAVLERASAAGVEQVRGRWCVVGSI